MNKETEMYLIKKIEELTKDLAFSYADNEKLVNEIALLKSNEKATKKALAFDVLSKFVIVQPNPVNNTYKLIFNIPEIDINQELAEMFIDLLEW